MKCVPLVHRIVNFSTMTSESSTPTIWLLLLLLPALLPAPAATFEGREAWCSRVCPAAPPPQSPSPPPSFNLTCPEPRCPQPVCPVPQCPPPSCPPPSPCPQCPTGSPPSPIAARTTLPWKALQTFNATYMGYYKVYSDMPLDWFEAQMICEEEGAHLLILNSMEEELFVRVHFIRPQGWIHVGVHDLIHEGERVTVLGKPVNSTGYNKWLYGHQHSNVKHNCAWIKKMDSGMGMGPCRDKGPFVCELSIDS